MNPGELDRRVELFEFSEGSNYPNNEPYGQDRSYGYVWAKYEPTSETEAIIDDYDQLRTFAKFTIRYIQSINETWKLKYNNKFYAINSIGPDPDENSGRFRYLVLQCESSQQTNFKT